MLRLVAEEWSPIRYQDGGEIAPLERIIPLLNSWNSVVGQNYQAYFDANVSRVVPKGWTGIIEGSGIQLQVTPGGSGSLTPAEKAALDHNIGYMVQAVVRPSIKPAGKATKSIEGYDLDSLVHEMCEEFVRARRQQVIRKYVRQRVVSSTIVGRLSFPAQLYESIRRPGLFATERNGLDEDIAENRYFKGVLVRCRQRVTGDVKVRVDALLADLDEVSVPVDIVRERASVDESRIPASYRKAFDLADAVFGGSKVGIFGGSLLSNSHVIFTSKLFERFLGHVVDKYSRRVGGICTIQSRGTFLASQGATGKIDRFEIIPDAIIQWGDHRNNGIVLDIKWKKFDPLHIQFGVQTPDIYQIISYATRMGFDKCALVYPWISTGPRPRIIHLTIHLLGRPITIFLLSLALAEKSMDDSVTALMTDFESFRSRIA
jgi:5-methylcytosine-specific restriction endonuclease McrBC regulatory subunit McrC